MTEINVVSKSQTINVNPASGSISVTNSGPPGPAGPPGPVGPGGPPGTLPTNSEFDVEPVNWGAHFRSAVDDADTRLVSVFIPGDSLSVGEGATNWRTKGYAGLITTALQSEFGDGGSGFIGAGWKMGAGSGGGQVTTTGAWTEVDNVGGLGRRYLRPTTPGSSSTIVTVCRGTAIDMYFKAKPGYGTWQYKIDSGSFTNVSLNETGKVKKVSVTGLSAGDHVVTIKDTSGDGGWYGNRGRNATGIIVDNISVSGTRLIDLAQNTTDMVASDGDPYRNTMIFKSMEAIAPVDLVILPMGINDIIFDVDDTVFMGDIWNAFACLDVAMREFGPTALTKRPDVMTVAMNPGKVDIIAGFSLWERDWLQLHAALRQYSATVAAAFVDMWGRLGRTWEQAALDNVWAAGNTDNVHLSDHGYQRVADAILNILDVT